MPQISIQDDDDGARLVEEPTYEELRARVAELEKERDRYRAALIWALGAGDDFPAREDGQGAYWWREGLQQRAELTWDSNEARFKPTYNC